MCLVTDDGDAEWVRNDQVVMKNADFSSLIKTFLNTILQINYMYSSIYQPNKCLNNQSV